MGDSQAGIGIEWHTMERAAAKLRIGLKLGLVTIRDVVKWCDSQIASRDQPEEALLDLALMNDAHPQDVFGKLLELSESVSAVEALPGVLADGVEQLRSNPGLGPVVARGLYQIYVDADYEVPSELLPIGRFDDEYDLAKQGSYGTEEQVFEALLTFAEGFRTIDRADG
jgi:hypothetical protein